MKTRWMGPGMIIIDGCALEIQFIDLSTFKIRVRKGDNLYLEFLHHDAIAVDVENPDSTLEIGPLGRP